MDAKLEFFELIISELPDNVKPFIKAIFENRNIVAKKMSDDILAELKIDIDNLLILLLPFAAEFANVNVSNYKVGAAVLCASGNIYLGSNMEFGGNSLNNSVHAEQSAINNAWLNGEKRILKIAVTAAPCGHCRQFLNEISSSGELKIILKNSHSKMIEIYELEQFLPVSFGPADLNINDSLMSEINHGLELKYGEDELLKCALEEANNSYAPYSENYSGVSIKTKEGTIFSGRYAENAAFNPSLSPLQSALSFMIMNSKLGTVHQITDAVLVESDSVISQKKSTEIILNDLTKAGLRYYKIKN